MHMIDNSNNEAEEVWFGFFISSIVIRRDILNLVATAYTEN